MTTSTAAGARDEVQPEISRAAGRWRVVLLVWLVVVVGVTVLSGTRPASLAELENGLRSGEVTEVHLIGALEPGMRGHTYPEIEWHDGLLPRYTQVQQIREDADNHVVADPDTPVVSNDLAGQLTAWTPTRELQVTTQDFRRGWHGELFSWYVPNWVAMGGLVWIVTTFFTLVSGPEPRWATRWAWFWLFWGSAGLAMIVYVVVGLPRAGQPLRPVGRRLTGGWAFLISLFLPGQR